MQFVSLKNFYFYSMHYYKNVLETIGNTPLIKLNQVVEDIDATVLAKVETTNPGNSVKDRMALKMVEDAEARGELKPGGVIIECTSGNTGMGLAIAAVVKGYRCIFTATSKQSKEKIDLLRALGATVIICPSEVHPDHPESYYSVAQQLYHKTPNSFWCNQYDNPSNVLAHYQSTGPEIWQQTQGQITHFIVGIGTGGTISGVGRYLKEQNPQVKIWGVEPHGSVLKSVHETGKVDISQSHKYATEGIGQDMVPVNVDFEIIDHIEKVSCKDAALMTRAILQKEAILVGNSAGAAVAGLLQLKKQLKSSDVVVVLFHDHASRYIGKILNDEWMEAQGYLNDTNRLVNS
ncbi:cystathionine beta-synthase [Microscilla marina ATCC 23134]|uniref:Cystathionine beta-synthase n=2 Tax=Microscilla marina TaxID=1027 RepID=A1ZUX3_MICM2|nr:cystathionine beta-synthase [Microscilla marina ATCC 23134]